jgi:hypothetical protein
MSDLLMDRRQLEMMLRGELEDAERLLNEATPEQKPEALKRFSQVLHVFTELVLNGKTPKESRCA